ncbi:MAG: hypothetical protein WCX08_04775 [Candidatus Buchananbacteria bacterium]|jgi:hypothetical protein
MPKELKGRYITRCLDREAGAGGLTYGNNYDELQGALDEIGRDATDPEVTHQILVDTKANVVELVKGDSIEPFQQMLGRRCLGWRLGTVER